MQLSSYRSITEMKPVYCNGCGAVLPKGIFSLLSNTKWDKDQYGPQDIRRDQVLDVPLLTFGKLNLPDKLAFSAASLALKSHPNAGGNQSAICIALPYGSLTTDMFFMESIVNNFPSPTYFSATLPSSTIADIAIYYKFKGPDRIFCGGNSPVLEAFSSAFQLIQLGKANTVLALVVWAFDNNNKKRIDCSQFIENSAFSILLSTSSELKNPKICKLTIDNPNAAYDTITEYNFCDQLIDALRNNYTGQIAFQPEINDNYIVIE